MDEVEKLTERARAAADGILAQAMPHVEEFPETLPLDVVRDLIAAGFGVGKQEGLAEGKVMVEELQAHLENLRRLLMGE